jgi:ribose transport system ATP-binding protein
MATDRVALVPFRVDIENLSKVYGSSQVLTDVSFALSSGSVVGLIGANGAGKSTLIKCLTGVVDATTGIVSVDGDPVSLASPLEGLKQGFSAVSQKVVLAETESVAENIMLGLLPSKGGIVARSQLKKDVDALLRRVGLDIEQSRPVGSLTPSEKRLVMIAAVLARNPRVIIFDEPTAALPAEASTTVLNLVKDLRSQGHAIIYISHRLYEVEELADSVVALSNGRVTGILEKVEITRGKMLSLIGGRDQSSDASSDVSNQVSNTQGEVCLEVRELSGSRVSDVSFSIHAGEIVGIGGLAGAGRSELLRLIYGLQAPTHGDSYVQGKALGKSLRSRFENKIGYLAELRDANVLKGLSVIQNASISGVGKHKKFRILADAAWEKHSTQEVGASVSLVGKVAAAIDTLSGGNQQKVLLGRLMIQDAQVLLLDEPTAGVDLVARAEIHGVLKSLSEQGKSVVVASVENEELAEICDRVLILVEGKLVSELKAPFTEEDLVNAYFYHHESLNQS